MVMFMIMMMKRGVTSGMMKDDNRASEGTDAALVYNDDDDGDDWDNEIMITDNGPSVVGDGSGDSNDMNSNDEYEDA